MSLYLKSKKIDLELGDKMAIILNEQQSDAYGIKEGQIVSLGYRDLELFVDVIQSNSKIEEGYVGLTEEIWERYKIPNDELVVVQMLSRPDSIDYIKKKLIGEDLTEAEIFEITKDISERRIRDVEVAYFMSCFFNPGFSDKEVVNIAKGMATAGENLSFHNYKGNGKIIVGCTTEEINMREDAFVSSAMHSYNTVLFDCDEEKERHICMMERSGRIAAL